jgi:hypothetical protein
VHLGRGGVEEEREAGKDGGGEGWVEGCAQRELG